MLLINAFSGMLTVFFVASVGFVLRRKGWVPDNLIGVLPRFIAVVVLPPFLIRSVTTGFKQEELIFLLSGVAIPLLTILLCFGIGALLVRLFNVRQSRRGAFKLAFSMSNSMNIGIPVNIALFGEQAVPYALVYFLSGDIFLWTIGNYCLARDSENASAKLFSLASLKKLFSPPIIGFFIGVLLVLLDLHLPAFADKTLKYLGDMAIPMSLLYIGMTVAGMPLNDLKLDRDALLVLAGRFVICPALVLLLVSMLPISDLMRKVFVIQASLPVMLNAAILVGYHGGDARFMTLVAGVTTILALATVPVWAVIVGLL